MTPLRILSYIDTVGRSGSIRKAAEQLHISSTALNRSILGLERELGTPLFERVKNGVRLSAAGEAYVLFARRTLGELERLRSDIEDLRGLRRGCVSVAAIQSVAGTLLPQAITDYQTRYPGVSFDVTIAGNDAVLEALAADEVELGITFNAQPHREIDILASIDQSLCALMAEDHPLARQDRVKLHECLGSPLGLADSSRIGRQLLDLMLHRAGFRGTPALVSNSFELLGTWCRMGGGICFQIGIGAPRGHGLVALPLLETGAVGRLMIAARRGRTLSTQVASFADGLLCLLREQSTSESAT
jgi:DNA-binding transcriptional LysR family regulator